MAKKSKKKKRKGKGKGSNFEREICKLLGLWWTEGERDDVFWRSSNSGGRAKSRSRKGQGTFGQYGDIQATDPIGQPLIDLCSIELKRGYNHVTIGDMLDLGEYRAKRPWEIMVGQAMADQRNAKRPWWLLISKRDRREPIIFLPWGLYILLNTYGADLNRARPFLKFIPVMKSKRNKVVVFASLLSEFTRYVKPNTIIEMVSDE